MTKLFNNLNNTFEYLLLNKYLSFLKEEDKKINSNINFDIKNYMLSYLKSQLVITEIRDIKYLNYLMSYFNIDEVKHKINIYFN